MNKIFRMAAAAAVLLSALSCSKEGAALFDGNYSFKTSGTLSADVTLTVKDSEGNITPEERDLDVDLTTEQGQMDIITTSMRNGEMVLTMNVLAGDVYTTEAYAKGQELTIEPFERKINVSVGQYKFAVPVTVSGMARKYADTVIFTLKYEGEGESSVSLPDGSSVDLSMNIKDSDVRCVAKLND